MHERRHLRGNIPDTVHQQLALVGEDAVHGGLAFPTSFFSAMVLRHFRKLGVHRFFRDAGSRSADRTGCPSVPPQRIDLRSEIEDVAWRYGSRYASRLRSECIRAYLSCIFHGRKHTYRSGAVLPGCRRSFAGWPRWARQSQNESRQMITIAAMPNNTVGSAVVSGIFRGLPFRRAGEPVIGRFPAGPANARVIILSSRFAKSMGLVAKSSQPDWYARSQSDWSAWAVSAINGNRPGSPDPISGGASLPIRPAPADPYP